ncbi:ABC-2 family transporter protein [Paenibacillus sp. FSL K6-4396]|uniref:ABC transporter permease n=1 Tax=unclassified Paenibacillus TaxID=185978 RepID=UPI0017801DC4|nr:ABC-2 family transporter protein [Paenibacillus sp. CFBP 13594]MBD8839082.1 ABC-2 family transporter protein [Paenibacillus sp. CFBP 13594]
MKKYLSVAKCTLQVKIAYPVTTLIDIFISIISLILMLNLWGTIYAGQSVIAGYTWSDMITYLVLVFIINTDSNSEYRCAKRIIDGSIAMTLIRPMSHNKNTMTEIGTTIAFTTVINLMIGFIILLFLGNGYLNFNFNMLFFFFSFINALLIKYLVVYTSSLMSFWTHNVQGVMWTRIAIVNLFSGALVPLEFFPQWLKNICEILPFQTIIHTPISIFLGGNDYTTMISLIMNQFFWILFFCIAVKFIYHFGIKKLTIHGG